jgi:hypothetical protein
MFLANVNVITALNLPAGYECRSIMPTLIVMRALCFSVSTLFGEETVGIDL